MKRTGNTNYTQLTLDILRGRWLLRDAETLLPYAVGFLERRAPVSPCVSAEAQPWLSAPVSARDSGGAGDGGDGSGKVAVIPVHGTLIKYDWCGAPGTATIGAAIREYAGRDDVAGVVLDFDSGGGACNAIPPLVQAIAAVKAKGKPIVAHADECCSAAYWAASQCDAVFMDNSLSEVGSIGAYCQVLDNRANPTTGERVIAVYAKESPDKNLGYRAAIDGDPEPLRRELSELVAQFHEAVKAGRPGLKAKEPGVLSGAVFRPDRAVELGLADGVMTLEECVENVAIRAEYNQQ